MRSIETLTIQPNPDHFDKCIEHLKRDRLFQPPQEPANQSKPIIIITSPKEGRKLIRELCRGCPISKGNSCPGLDEIDRQSITLPGIGEINNHILNPGVINLMRIYINGLPENIELPLEPSVRFKIQNQTINARLIYTGEIPEELQARNHNYENNALMLEYMIEGSGIRIRHVSNLATNLLNKTGQIIRKRGLFPSILQGGVVIGDTFSRPLGNIDLYKTEGNPRGDARKNYYYVVAEIRIGGNTKQQSPNISPSPNLN